MSSGETVAGTEFLVGTGADHEAMARLGLGGIAVAGGRAFFGSMAINLTTLSRVAEADTITDETNVCMEQVVERLKLSGCRKEDVVKITAYSQEKEYIPEMWEALDAFFAPGPYPKRVTVVSGIGVDCRLEFELVVAQPKGVTA